MEMELDKFSFKEVYALGIYRKIVEYYKKREIANRTGREEK